MAFVTRGEELLVFRHRDFPDAGLQVPAGTTEEGEDPQAAALREVRGERGLTDVRVVGFLGRYLSTPRHIGARYTTATCAIWS